jgi:hypothetical protein
VIDLHTITVEKKNSVAISTLIEMMMNLTAVIKTTTTTTTKEDKKNTTWTI